jgi:hypothetical protein
LERLRRDWVTDYDFVLIDSRTGWADIASICTAHLPDRLVLVFTANAQSIRGAVEVAAKANEVRDRLPYDRPKLPVMPVLSRFDSRVEYKRAEMWYQTCTELTTPLFSNWLVKHVPPTLMMRHLTLPYVSYWSFGEQLPVLEEVSPSTDQVAYALETVAAIVAHRFDRTDLLADNRDAYVASARGQTRTFELDMLVSSPRSAERIATELVFELERLGLRAKRSLSGDIDFLGMKRDTARHLCLIIDEKVNRWQTAEAEWFLRRTLVAEERRLFPVLTTLTNATTLPGFLRNLQSIQLSPGSSPSKVARKLCDEISADGTSQTDEKRRILANAISILDWSGEGLRDYEGWFHIEQILNALDPAVDHGDLEAMQRLIANLEYVSHTQLDGTGGRIAAPTRVLELVSELTIGITRHLKRLS